MSHWVSVSAVRIKVASHLATLNHFAADLGILKRQRALVKLLGASKPSVRQRIKRLRAEFAEFYELIEGELPPSPILIQSRGKRDYRIDPTSVIQCDLPLGGDAS